MKDSYLPVSCDFHDELLGLATKKERIKVYIFNEKGTLDEISGIIKDVYTKMGEEFLLIESQSPIRLDKIVTYNGKPGPNYDRLEEMDHDCHECK